jgi:hypothetical protein
MTKPLIQVGDEVREMTDEEHANYLEIIKDAKENPYSDSPTDAE